MKWKAPVQQIAVCASAGAGAGLCLGLLPRFGGWSEIRNFQLLLLELSYQGLTRVLPLGAMRALDTAWGELVTLSAIGALIGLGIGVCRYGRVSRISQHWVRSAAGLSFSATVGVLVSAFGILWCRIALFHATSRMVSLEGLWMVLASLGSGMAVAVGIWWGLRWLARYHLEKACAGLGLLLLLVGAIGSSLVGQAVPAVPHGGFVLPVKQVVLLGADGATWDVALPMIKEGKLPHLAALMARGTWSDLRTTIPWKSPIIWTSIATGKRSQAHGIHDFVVRDQATHTVIPVSVSLRKVKAIWDIVSEAGLRVDAVNWYASWPAEPLNGTMLSYRFLQQGLSEQVFPPERTREIDELVEQLEQTGLPRDERMIAQVGLFLLEHDRPDLHLLYLRDIDGMQHFFWRYHAARRGSLVARWLYGPTDPAALTEKGRRIEEAYEQLDAVLGRVLALVGPHTAIVVVSDHGGGIKAPGQLYFTLNPVLEQWGWLRYLPDGKTIDWATTQVYDATKRPWYEQRELFINRRPEGPFGGGIREEAERQLLHAVVERLNSLRTGSGKPVVTKAWVRESTHEARLVVARVNVMLEPNDTMEGHDTTRSVSQMMWRTPRTGTHRAPGILVMAGPGIQSGSRLRAASVLDLTPTMLYLLGLPVANDMEGRVLLEAFEPAARRARPVHMVATYETGPARAALPIRQSPADEEQLEQMRSLGYIQ